MRLHRGQDPGTCAATRNLQPVRVLGFWALILELSGLGLPLAVYALFQSVSPWAAGSSYMGASQQDVGRQRCTGYTLRTTHLGAWI